MKQFEIDEKNLEKDLTPEQRATLRAVLEKDRALIAASPPFDLGALLREYPGRDPELALEGLRRRTRQYEAWNEPAKTVQ